MQKDFRQVQSVPQTGTESAGLPVRYVDVQSYGYSPYADGLESTGGLIEYWQILWRGKWKLVLAGALAALIAFSVTLLQTPIYRAAATLEIQPLNQDFLNMRQMTPVQESAISDAAPLGDIPTQLEIIRSDLLLDRVAAKFTHDHEPDHSLVKKNRHGSEAPRLSDFFPRRSRISQDGALALAIKTFDVKATAETRIVTLSCDSTDPKLAAEFVNNLGTEYIKQNLEARLVMNEQTARWLADQLGETRNKLERQKRLYNPMPTVWV